MSRQSVETRTVQYRMGKWSYLFSILAHVALVLLFLQIYVSVIEPPPEELEIDLVGGAQLMDPSEATGKMKVLMERLEELEKASKELEAAEKALKASLGQYGEELIESFALDGEIGGDSDSGFDYGESFQQAQELVELGKEAVEPLLDALENLEDDFKTRRRTAKILAMLKEERALPTLIERFVADADPANWGIMVAMNKMAEDNPKHAKIVGTELLRHAKIPEEMGKMAKKWLFVSATAVGGRGKWEKQLERFLLDGDKSAKEGVFYTLHDAGPVNKKTQNTLAKVMLQDEDEDIRAGAATGIAYSGFKIEVAGDLKRAFKNDSSAKVRGAALGALNSTALEDRVDINALATKDVAAPIRAAGAGGLSSGYGTHAISSADRKQAVKALMSVIEDKDRNVRMRAIGALGDLKSREAIPDVVRAIKSKDTKVRDAALYSLQRIAAAVSLDDDTLDLLMELGSDGNTRALDIVRQYAPRDKAIEFMTYHLKSDNIPLRCIAMIHLVALKATEAADVIGKMTSHPRLGVRGRAIWAIGRLGQKQYISTLLAQLHDRDILSGKGIDIHAWASGTSGKFWYLHPHAAAARPSVIEALGWLHATEAIPDLIHIMETHAHPGTRLQVAGLLQNWADLDDRIVPALVRFAEDVHPQTQLKVIDWLGASGGKQAVPYLQRIMKGEWRTAAEAAPFAIAAMEDRTIWSACVEALVKLGDTSIIPYLKKELKNAGDDEGKKSQIVSSLRRLGDAEGDRIARENFLRQLDSKDDAVAGLAALALANMGEESVIPKLKGLAKKLPANTPRLNVLKALVKLGHRDGVPQLLSEIIANRDAKSTAPILASDFAPHINAIECIPAMNDRIINDEGQYHMRYRTALALCALGHPDGIPALVHRKIMKGPHAYGGAWIMEGLGNFKDKRVVRALVEFLEDKNDWVGMRAICAESLGRIGDPEAVPALINQLRDVAMRDHAARVRVNSAGALASIGSMVAVGPLVEVAQGDRDSSVRRAAISALAKMKVPEAIDVSLEALKDESAYVRAAAAVSLNVTTGVDYKYFAETAKAYPNNSQQLKPARKMVDQARRNDAKIKALEKTVTESPDNLDTYLELAELCEKLSMSNKAASVYRRYVRAAGDQAKAEVIAKVGRAGSGSLGGDGSWWLIGPFEWAGFSDEYPPQNKIKDEAYVGKGGVGISWRKVTLEPDVRGEVRCDFGRFVPGSYVESVFFVYRTLSSDRERRLRLLFGSDDGIKVWFNGKEVISSDVYRAMQKDQEGAVVTFSKGANRLLIRINNGLYGGGFILRITDNGGKPVKVDVQGALL